MIKKIAPFLAFYIFASVAQADLFPIFQDTSFEDVSALVKKKSPQALGDLLALLPEKYRRSYTMIYDSDSIQTATPANPRVVLYGKLAKFILTFNGDPSQEGYDRAEILQFRDDTQKFELRKITFANNTATVSDANPAECVACHGDDPKPFWHGYNNWPGVFGSADDSLSGDEVSQYATFLAMAPQHDRYKNLVRRTDISTDWPYRVDGRHVNRANDRFGRLVGGLATQSATRQVLNSPFYEQYPNAFLYHFLRCDTQNADAYLAKIDALFQARFPPSIYPQQYADLATMTNTHDQATYKLERLVLNQADGSWDLSMDFQSGGVRFTPDGFNLFSNATQIDDMIATRVLAQVSDIGDTKRDRARNLKNSFRRRNFGRVPLLDRKADQGRSGQNPCI